MVFLGFVFFFFKQKTAYDLRISDWSSDVCSSDLRRRALYRNFISLAPLKDLAAAAEVVGMGVPGTRDRCRRTYNIHQPSHRRPGRQLPYRLWRLRRPAPPVRLLHRRTWHMLPAALCRRLLALDKIGRAWWGENECE